jgi:hypothetical protein
VGEGKAATTSSLVVEGESSELVVEGEGKKSHTQEERIRGKKRTRE